MRRLLLWFLLVILAICFAKQTIAQNIGNKSYAIECRAVDSVFKTLNDADSATVMAKLNMLTNKYKGDAQLKYLLRIGELNWRFRHGKKNVDFEKDLLDLSEHLNKKGLDKLRAEVLTLEGEYYWKTKKDLSRALENYIYAYDISTTYSIDEFPHKGEVVYWLAVQYYTFRDFDTEKKYLLEYFHTVPEYYPVDRPGRLNTMGLCYQSLEQYDSASYYFKKGLDVSIKEHSKEWESLSSGNLAYISYLEKKYDESLALFESDTSFKEGVNMDDADALSVVGEMYYFKKNNKKALELVTRAYDIIMKVLAKRKKLDYYDVKVIYPRIARVFASAGKPMLAYSLLDTVTTADDSVFKSRNAILMAGVQHKTEAQKHMAEIQKKEEEVAWQKKLRNNFIIGFCVVLFLSLLALYQKRRITKEKARSDMLLLNILPAETAEELKNTGAAKARKYDSVSVLFTDFKNFTAMSETLNAEDLVAEIDHYYSSFDEILSRYDIEKIKTIGDSYMCVSGLPHVSEDHAIKAVSAAIEMLDFIEKEKVARERNGKTWFEMRVGIHSGHLVAGIVGKKKFAYDVWGDTVNVASRIEAASHVGRINISEATYDLVKDKFSCTYRGEMEAKNKGMMKMYFVEGPVI